MLKSKKLVYTALCTALCVVLPIAFHGVPNFGRIFLPMHIPVLLCGLMCGWPMGLVCGILGPLLSGTITSMPPAPMLPSMMVELGTYGLISGLLMERVHTGSNTADIYISLLTAMVLGRTSAGLAGSLLFSPGTAPFAWVTGSLIVGLPGIIVQLILIPLLIYVLKKSHLIPGRY